MKLIRYVCWWLEYHTDYDISMCEWKEVLKADFYTGSIETYSNGRFSPGVLKRIDNERKSPIGNSLFLSYPMLPTWGQNNHYLKWNSKLTEHISILLKSEKNSSLTKPPWKWANNHSKMRTEWILFRIEWWNLSMNIIWNKLISTDWFIASNLIALCEMFPVLFLEKS